MYRVLYSSGQKSSQWLSVKENSVKVSLAMICFSNHFNLIKDNNNKDLVFLRIYLKIGMFQMFITTQIYCKMPSKMHRSCDPISDYEVNVYLPPTNVCVVISFIEDELWLSLLQS